MTQSITVMKFGSSILANASYVRHVAREIANIVKDGNKIVAVVSALQGETDRLFSAVHEVDAQADPYRIATFVSTGEQQSVCLLRIALASADVEAKAADHRDLNLIAAGDPLDSDPLSLDTDWVHQQLAEADVLVVPGFVAIDEKQRDVLLGRGGSDDTALFIAHQLGAKCTLIKDVDGVFESDPNAGGEMPGRFKEITYLPI